MGSVDGMARHAAAPRTWLHLPMRRRRAARHEGEDGVVERERAGGEGDGWVVGGAWRGVGWVAGASMGRCPHVRRVVVRMLVGGGGEGGG